MFLVVCASVRPAEEGSGRPEVAYRAILIEVLRNPIELESKTDCKSS